FRYKAGGRPSIPTGTDPRKIEYAPLTTHATPRTRTADVMPKRNWATMKATRPHAPAIFSALSRDIYKNVPDYCARRKENAEPATRREMLLALVRLIPLLRCTSVGELPVQFRHA